MSAFIVDKAHIDTLVQAGLAYGRRYTLAWYHDHEPTTDEGSRTRTNTRHELSREAADRVGAMLWNTNRASVDYRYEEANDREVYRYRHNVCLPMAPVAVLKAIDCYEYQSCEHPEWESSEARAFCSVLRKAMICALPGYEEAAWAISPAATSPRDAKDGGA
jgi:hypothetical protein